MNPLAWMDVISSDIDRTLDYYTEVFGWSHEQLPIEHGEGYRVVRSGDVIVAGAEEVAAERELDPVWTLMVETDDARGVIDAGVAAGATETFELSPMLDLGRIAMLRDPWGATLGVWEPGTFRPSIVPASPGRLTGAVLATPAVEDSIRFHREVFGWQPALGPHDLEAGIPVYVEAGDTDAIWIPILSGPAVKTPSREGVAAPRLAEAGVHRCVDPMGASFYFVPYRHNRPPIQETIREDTDEPANS